MNYKNLEKIQIQFKFKIRILQCNPVSNFSQFGEFLFEGPNVPNKHFRVDY